MEEKNNLNTSGNQLFVHSYESMGTYDGPGLRLVVFLQGCNFHCLYCSNPDTISDQEGIHTNIEEIVQMAIRQKSFFGEKGGVTFSGGEPLLQAKNLIPLVKRLHEEKINVCIDTNGSVWNENVADLLLLVDLVLLDVKHINIDKHLLLTGCSNRKTIELTDWLEKNNIPFWLRYVLVPGYSDAKKDLILLGEHFFSYKMIRRLDILPYHTLGKHKYEYLKKPYLLNAVKENTPKQLEEAKTLFSLYFTDVRVC